MHTHIYIETCIYQYTQAYKYLHRLSLSWSTHCVILGLFRGSRESRLDPLCPSSSSRPHRRLASKLNYRPSQTYYSPGQNNRQGINRRPVFKDKKQNQCTSEKNNLLTFITTRNLK